jgi:hypothetical protein
MDYGIKGRGIPSSWATNSFGDVFWRAGLSLWACLVVVFAIDRSVEYAMNSPAPE